MLCLLLNNGYHVVQEHIFRLFSNAIPYSNENLKLATQITTEVQLQ